MHSIKACLASYPTKASEVSKDSVSSSTAGYCREIEKLKEGAVCNIIHIYINVVLQGFLTKGLVLWTGQNQEIRTHTVTLSCCFSADTLGTRSERVKREMWETEAGLELPFGTVTSGQLYFSVILKGVFQLCRRLFGSNRKVSRSQTSVISDSSSQDSTFSTRIWLLK